ncbi:protein RGF1 INDUCIBLE TRANSCRIPTION FACTOR 1-like [Arachis duranensis]|uniref:Protein RGF1 INDUCIBLE TRANSCRIPTION FACTOR 1-like n=1 Tax=Arachis duranensis TaxID=130453 RepID=A0A6P4CU52_ARADU|nr:protein RGF1 INDUCIBLE TRANSCRIPTION FACTOR 1-like [Arachis duranensis]
MSSSSSNQVAKAKKVKKALQPEWLKSLLKRTFFESSCATHPVLKNELNQYCVTCTELICQNCASGPKHVLHKVITIYKHSYKAVVRIDAMREHIDCSQIQPYKSNKLSVIALEPLPHHGSVKWRRASSCKTCRRKLANPNLYRYCSISCKVQAVLTFILLKEDQKEEAGTSKRVNKRKGTPARAPFF